MKAYNFAFFGLYENVFNTAIGRYGLDETISLFSELMERGLSKSYGNDFKKGEILSFAKIVGHRDNNVGLKDSTYIPFKIRYILGEDWEYKYFYQHFTRNKILFNRVLNSARNAILLRNHIEKKLIFKDVEALQ